MSQFLRTPVGGRHGSLAAKPGHAGDPPDQLSEAASALAPPPQPCALHEACGEVVDRLAVSPFYEVYSKSFRAAAGLPCQLVAAGPRSAARTPDCYQTSFCRAVNSGENPCRSCLAAQRFLQAAAQHRTMSIECAAGLKETAIPLLVGGRAVGHLMTGQVRTRSPKHPDFARIFAGASPTMAQNRELCGLYRQVPVIDRASYRRMVGLLMGVRAQIATLMERIALELRTGDPDPLRLGMETIVGQLGNGISAASITRQANVAHAEFTRLLFQSAGMTAPEFIELQRVELAKLELLRRGNDIATVADQLGFRSVSDFDHRFKKLVGKSAAAYRAGMRLAMFPHLSV